MEINNFLSKHVEIREFLRFSNALIPIRVRFPFRRGQSISELKLWTSEKEYSSFKDFAQSKNRISVHVIKNNKEFYVPEIQKYVICNRLKHLYNIVS